MEECFYMGTKADVTIGKQFGYWTVIDVDVKNPESKAKRKRNGALCRCICGKEKYVAYTALYNGISTDCGCETHKRLAKKRMENNAIPIGTKFGELTVIENNGIVKYHKQFSKCQCSCGNIIEVQNRHLKSGHTKSCGCCTVSFGSNKIKQLLKDNNINFITEYTFNDLRSPLNGIYRFDFAIFKNKELYELIEFDGPQHFSPQAGYFEGKFEQIKQNDNIKNEYCKTHNIKLIRIPYTQENNIDLKMLELENYFNED